MFFFFFKSISREEQMEIDQHLWSAKVGYSYPSEPATKDEWLANVVRLKNFILLSGERLEVVGINKIYPYSCICKVDKKQALHIYLITDRRIRDEGEFRGWANKSNWENAPNYIKVEDIHTYEGDW